LQVIVPQGLAQSLTPFFCPDLATFRTSAGANSSPRLPTKPDMAANNRMKAARVLKGLTQMQLAEKVGTREIEISRIETGRVTPDAQIKQRIANALQKPTFELFDN
jgi:DNA-binding XRE family transcriptional regulator